VRHRTAADRIIDLRNDVIQHALDLRELVHVTVLCESGATSVRCPGGAFPGLVTDRTRSLARRSLGARRAPLRR
jgi:hypothetical protein